MHGANQLQGPAEYSLPLMPKDIPAMRTRRLKNNKLRRGAMLGDRRVARVAGVKGWQATQDSSARL